MLNPTANTSVLKPTLLGYFICLALLAGRDDYNSYNSVRKYQHGLSRLTLDSCNITSSVSIGAATGIVLLCSPSTSFTMLLCSPSTSFTVFLCSPSSSFPFECFTSLSNPLCKHTVMPSDELCAPEDNDKQNAPACLTGPKTFAAFNSAPSEALHVSDRLCK